MPIQLPMLVCREPFVVQLPDIEGQDHAFYDSLHPSMPVVWVLSAMREFEEPVDIGDRALTEITAEGVQHAVGLRNRVLYLQLLEGLFAHIFANAQFPVAPQAWLARYRPVDLRELAGHLRQSPWSVPDVVPALNHSNELVSWLFGVERMGALTREERDHEVRAVMRVLALLAADYPSEGMDREYNSSKHGLRAMPAAWSLAIAPSGRPDLRATLGATHGSHFFVDERGPTGAKHYFTLRKRSQSWHPERDLKLAQLASWLLHNLVSARRSIGPGRPFYAFRNIDLDQLTALVQRIHHFEMGVPLDMPETVASRADVASDAAIIVQNVATWVADRSGVVAATRAGPPADVDPDDEDPA